MFSLLSVTWQVIESNLKPLTSLWWNKTPLFIPVTVVTHLLTSIFMSLVSVGCLLDGGRLPLDGFLPWAISTYFSLLIHLSGLDLWKPDLLQRRIYERSFTHTVYNWKVIEFPGKNPQHLIASKYRTDAKILNTIRSCSESDVLLLGKTMGIC